MHSRASRAAASVGKEAVCCRPRTGTQRARRAVEARAGFAGAREPEKPHPSPRVRRTRLRGGRGVDTPERIRSRPGDDAGSNSDLGTPVAPPRNGPRRAPGVKPDAAWPPKTASATARSTRRDSSAAAGATSPLRAERIPLQVAGKGLHADAPGGHPLLGRLDGPKAPRPAKRLRGGLEGFVGSLWRGGVSRGRPAPVARRFQQRRKVPCRRPPPTKRVAA